MTLTLSNFTSDNLDSLGNYLCLNLLEFVVVNMLTYLRQKQLQIISFDGASNQVPQGGWPRTMLHSVTLCCFSTSLKFKIWWMASIQNEQFLGPQKHHGPLSYWWIYEVPMNILETTNWETLSWSRAQEFWSSSSPEDDLQWPQVAKAANFWWDDSNKAQVAQISVESIDNIMKRHTFGICMYKWAKVC